jgi:hypothetical protein
MGYRYVHPPGRRVFCCAPAVGRPPSPLHYLECRDQRSITLSSYPSTVVQTSQGV